MNAYAPPFSRPVAVDSIKEHGLTLAFAATAEECAALATPFGIFFSLSAKASEVLNTLNEVFKSGGRSFRNEVVPGGHLSSRCFPASAQQASPFTAHRHISTA